MFGIRYYGLQHTTSNHPFLECFMVVNGLKAARVCLTLFACSGGRQVAIGWCNCQLFDYKHELRVGTLSLPMWPDDEANPIGTCVENFVSNAFQLIVEFDSYQLPVVFPTETAGTPLSLFEKLCFPQPIQSQSKSLKIQSRLEFRRLVMKIVRESKT